MMRKNISFLLALALLLGALAGLGATAQAATDYSTVRVLLSTGSVNTMTIPVSGSYFIEENGAAFSGGTLSVKVSGNQLKVTHSKAGELYAGSSVNIMRERMDPGAGYLRIATSHGTRSYLGHLRLRYSGGYIQAINTVPLAHYLYGVVAYEMNDNFPLEALKAQAVAAKCYVLANMSPTSHYDIGDTSSDQVYKGYEASYKNVIKAVDATWNVGLYLGSSILCSYFAASNGGQTILPSDAWGGTNRYQWDKAYARVTDKYDLKNPLSKTGEAYFPKDGEDGGLSRTAANYLRTRAAEALESAGYRGITVVSIDSINAFEASSSTRAQLHVTLTWRDQGDNYGETNLSYALTFSDIATYVMGLSGLRLYALEEDRQGYTLTAARYGHGVGLSQRGAEQMANEGWKYDRILDFYYPGASLKTMNVSEVADPVNTKAGASTGTAAAGEPIATAVTTGGVNMRSGPGTNYSKLGQIPKGTSVYVYARSGGWSQVLYQNALVYVSEEYLKLSALAQADTTVQAPTEKTVVAYGEVTSNTLNFRKSAINGAVLQKLKKGDTLEIYGYVENSTWYYCSAKGQDGYVSAQYVKLTGSPADTDTPQTTPPASDMAAAGSIGVINNTQAYWHKNPRIVAQDIMGRIPENSRVTLSGAVEEFYIVIINGTTGYVHRDDITVTDAASGSAASGNTAGGTAVMGTGTTTGNVNFRKGPGTGYTSMGKLAKGTSLTLYSLSNGWYHVLANGTEGYVSAQYVKMAQAAAPTGTGSTSAGSTTTVWTGRVVNEWVRLRSSADYSTQENIIGDYDVGTQLTITGRSGSWYKVQTPDGKTGFMHGDYVEVTGEVTARTGKTTARVNFRSSMSSSGSGNIISTLAKGTPVTILGESGEWYNIQVGSQTGYAVKRYIG